MHDKKNWLSLAVAFASLFIMQFHRIAWAPCPRLGLGQAKKQEKADVKKKLGKAIRMRV